MVVDDLQRVETGSEVPGHVTSVSCPLPWVSRVRTDRSTVALASLPPPRARVAIV
jgi:hypothetical protein